MISAVFVLLFIGAAHSAGLPKGWKRCSKSDPKMNECLKVAIHDAFQAMKNGEPSLGILPVDPLHFSRIELDPGTGGPVSVNLTFIECDVVGLTNVIFKEVKFDWDKTQYYGKFEIPKPLNLVGKYHIDGKVLLLPIVGHGDADFKFDNLQAEMRMSGKKEKKGSKTHVKIDKTSVTLEASHLNMKFDNLFNGDKTLGDNINKVINENWEELFKAFSDTYSQAFGQAFQQIANRVFSKVPLEDIYLP